MAEPVVVVPYDPRWPLAFVALRDRAAQALGDIALAAEHVGSGAVPGLCAKLIIDLDVVVRTSADLPRAIARLATLGYVHEGDLGVLGRHAFAWPPGEPRCYLYVCPADSPALRRHLLFRDELRRDAAAAAAYAALKLAAAQRFRDDRAAYTAAKDAFVAKILRRHGERA